MSEIAERVRAIVARNLNLACWIITPDSTLSKLGADSLDAIGLIMAVERELGCCLPSDAFRAGELMEGEWTFGAFAGAVESSVQSAQQTSAQSSAA